MGWKKVGIHKWLANARITESHQEIDGELYGRFTATICGWRGWKIYEGPMRAVTTEELIAKTESIRDRIESGDENVFLEK